MDRNEVSTAFEIVLEEVETVVDSLNEDGAGAFRKGDYETAKKLIEDATRLTDFRSKVRTLQKEWESLFSSRIPKKSGKKNSAARLERGLRTPEDAFARPLLETIVEMGGSAQVSRILEQLGLKVKTILNDYDRLELPSYPHEIRWRNSAQWCRNTLVLDGLLKSDSPRGIWEISDKGRSALKNNEI